MDLSYRCKSIFKFYNSIFTNPQQVHLGNRVKKKDVLG